MNKKILFLVLLPIFAWVACSEVTVENPIVIKAGIAKKGQVPDDVEKLFQLGDTLVYQFEVISPDGFEKIEFSSFAGVGVNQKAPVVLSKVENLSGTTWILVDTIENIQEDVRYSVYVQDLNRQYKSMKINAYLDVSRYLSTTLYDGLTNGTSKTFINVESGRTFYIANTIGDPAGIDFGFTYMENKSNVLAALVSFDAYWYTGNYATVANDLNQPVTFRKSPSANVSSSTWIKSKVKNANDLKVLFDSAVPYSSVLPLLPDEKAAVNLKARDVVAFKTADGRYGLLQVISVDTKSGSPANTQKITFAMVVEKKLQ